MQKFGVFILIFQTLKLVVMMFFSFSWQEEHFYAFPPFSCITQFINKIELESATGILVATLFTTQPSFTRLLIVLTGEPLLLPKFHTCLYFPYRLRNPPNIPNFWLLACHVSGKNIDRKEFHQKLQKLSCSLGNQGLEINTAPIRKRRYSFLLNGIKINHVLNFFTLLSDLQCGLQCLKYNSQYAIIFCWNWWYRSRETSSYLSIHEECLQHESIFAKAQFYMDGQ